MEKNAEINLGTKRKLGFIQDSIPGHENDLAKMKYRIFATVLT